MDSGLDAAHRPGMTDSYDTNRIILSSLAAMGRIEIDKLLLPTRRFAAVLLPQAGGLWNFWQVCGKSAGIRPPQPVTKSKKTSPRPFPKAVRVGTYPPAPDGLCPGLPSKEAFGTGEASHAHSVGPQSTVPGI
jgi:hypothetical protein